LYGQCISYGVDKFPFCIEDSNGSIEALVERTRFAMETTSKSLKKFTLVYKKTSSDEFVEYLKPKLQNFVRHNFVSR
jgi:hypothetical protein